jgi:uncharacterized membrane protein
MTPGSTVTVLVVWFLGLSASALFVGSVLCALSACWLPAGVLFAPSVVCALAASLGGSLESRT